MSNTSNKSRTSAFIFSMFLGMFGAHCFYVGRTGRAVAMLLGTLFIIGFPIVGIINFIDWVMILAGNFKDSDGKVVSNW